MRGFELAFRYIASQLQSCYYIIIIFL